MSAILEVKNLQTRFNTEAGLVKAVNDVSFTVNEKEIVGIVGESGCGKSVTQLSVMRLINYPGEIKKGEIILDGQDIMKYPAGGAEMRSVRGGKIGMIFQEPMTSLNPVLTIGQQLSEAMMLHLNMNKQEARKRSAELLSMVGIPSADTRLDDYPHQFSGGMRQRVMVAMGLSCNPRILIADEPTTALDVTTQAQLLELMKVMIDKFDSSLILVTHNLGVVARYAQRIYIMYAGRVVETGTCEDIFRNPCHPYTMALLRCIPRIDETEGRKLASIKGLPPNLIYLPKTCPFLPRCEHAIDRCRTEPCPDLEKVGEGQYARCYVDPEQLRAKALAEEDKQYKPDLTGRDTILDVKNLKIYFPVLRGLLRKKVADVKAVDGVSFNVKRGETFGLVGESGCGKTTVGRALIRLYKPTEGNITFEGKDIYTLPERKFKSVRSKISLIFQDPYSSLDPRQNVASIVGEPMLIHNTIKSKAEYEERVNELFRIVGLDPAMGSRYPHEFSGGQRQRIGIARALSAKPSLIICDEPISALDVSIQAQIMNLLKDLQSQLSDLTFVFVAHDLAVVKHISDRIAVMYLGHIVEISTSKELYRNPLHPYTQALLSAIPIPDPVIEKTRQRIVLAGEVPSPLNPPTGCTFHTRCTRATKECSEIIPELKDVSPDHQVACIKV